MDLGAVFPTTQIGTDPAVIRDFAQTAEGLGYRRLLGYDHVLGAVHADRTPPLTGPYTERDPFHEPLVLLGYLAACMLGPPDERPTTSDGGPTRRPPRSAASCPPTAGRKSSRTCSTSSGRSLPSWSGAATIPRTTCPACSSKPRPTSSHLTRRRSASANWSTSRVSSDSRTIGQCPPR